jgi:hypothetical protein
MVAGTSHQEAPVWFFALFPFFFAGMWILATTIIGAASGWFALQKRYPATPGPALLTMRFMSAGMRASGVPLPASFAGMLTLSACASGLRVSMWRVFGPFCRPFLVPWDEIRVETRTGFLMPQAVLRFGDPAVAAMTLEMQVWQRLAESAGHDPGIPQSERLDAGGLVRLMLIQWLVVTSLAAAFFSFTSRFNGEPGAPLAACIGLPALVFGVSQLIRYRRVR